MDEIRIREDFVFSSVDVFSLMVDGFWARTSAFFSHRMRRVQPSSTRYVIVIGRTLC
jgi:hypothetical protein